MVFHVCKTWIPFTQGWFVPSLVEISPVGSGEEMKMWKVYRQTEPDLSAQVSQKKTIS